MVMTANQFSSLSLFVQGFTTEALIGELNTFYQLDVFIGGLKAKRDE